VGIKDISTTSNMVLDVNQRMVSMKIAIASLLLVFGAAAAHADCGCGHPPKEEPQPPVNEKCGCGKPKGGHTHLISLVK
jgi:hypothetical protein